MSSRGCSIISSAKGCSRGPLDKILLPGCDKKIETNDRFVISDKYGLGHEIPCRFIFPSKESSTLVIFSHGNGVTIDCSTGFDADIIEASVLLFEYPGYGRCEGIASAMDIDAQYEAVLKYVMYELNWPLKDVFCCGQSIGTGPTCKIVSQFHDKLGGMILISPFMSTSKLVADHTLWPLKFLFHERWNNLANIRKIKQCPILLIHGDEDEVIPVIHSCKLYYECELKPNDKNIIIYDSIGHNNLNHTQLMIDIAKFIKTSKNKTVIEQKSNKQTENIDEVGSCTTCKVS
jgi:pimeloyl-ACP methyl ester carboxylesterase